MNLVVLFNLFSILARCWAGKKLEDSRNIAGRDEHNVKMPPSHGSGQIHGQVGSRGFQISRVGSGYDYPTGPARSNPTRENVWKESTANDKSPTTPSEGPGAVETTKETLAANSASSAFWNIVFK